MDVELRTGTCRELWDGVFLSLWSSVSSAEGDKTGSSEAHLLIEAASRFTGLTARRRASRFYFFFFLLMKIEIKKN